MAAAPQLGVPRLHLRSTDSTNLRARELAARGAPHGTLVSAGEQSAGRGRQGRSWSAPPGRALLCSLVIRRPPRLLSLAGGVAVAEAVEALRPGWEAQIKWPNDVWVEGRKLAGILVEGRPQEDWAVIGIGLNVALRDADLRALPAARAGSLGLEPRDLEPALAIVLRRLEAWIEAAPAAVLEAVRARDALAGRMVSWGPAGGIAAGIDERGRLLVEPVGGGERLALEAGEVHLAADSIGA